MRQKAVKANPRLRIMLENLLGATRNSWYLNFGPYDRIRVARDVVSIA